MVGDTVTPEAYSSQAKVKAQRMGCLNNEKQMG
jgi:hypothetical protein